MASERRSYRAFAAVILAAADYRDAESDPEFHAARQALAVEILRWEFAVPADAVVEVEIIPLHEQTRTAGRTAGGWEAVTRAVCEWPDAIPFGKANSAPWFRLYSAAQRWARACRWKVRETDGRRVAAC